MALAVHSLDCSRATKSLKKEKIVSCIYFFWAVVVVVVAVAEIRGLVVNGMNV